MAGRNINEETQKTNMTVEDAEAGDWSLQSVLVDSAITKDLRVPSNKNAMRIGPVTMTNTTILSSGSITVASNVIKIFSGNGFLDHNLDNSSKIQFTTTAPTGASLSTDYWVVKDSNDSFRLSSVDTTDGVTSPSIVTLTNGNYTTVTITKYPWLYISGNLTII